MTDPLGQYIGATHDLQTDDMDAATVAEYFPAAHAVQFEAPAVTEYVPAIQLEQMVYPASE